MRIKTFIGNLEERWHDWRAANAKEPPDDHRAFGRWGEEQAAKALRRRGWKVLYRNFRAEAGGEVDLICRDRETLSFVEVKARRTEAFGRPSHAVNQDKQRLIIRGAFAWLRLLDRPDLTFRFDIVEVLAEKERTTIRVLESAFHLPDVYRY